MGMRVLKMAYTQLVFDWLIDKEQHVKSELGAVEKVVGMDEGVVVGGVGWWWGGTGGVRWWWGGRGGLGW